MPTSLLSQFEAELKTLADAWLPRTADLDQWGFHENWDEHWQKTPDESRFLVFQGRLTWVAGAIGLHYPEQKEAMAKLALHGAKGLMEVMWDKKNGGWWWRTDLQGNPLPSCLDQKHSYGNSFGLYGLASAYRLTGDPQVKEWLEEAFNWVDSHSHDKEHGGYRDALGADGRVLTSPVDPSQPIDFLGSSFGDKSQNTALHVLEALTEVYKAMPNPETKARLEEMLEITLTKMLLPGDWLAVRFNRDWTPIDTRPSWGHDIEAAFLIVEARRALGRPIGKEDEIAERIVMKSLEGLDEESGGFWDAIWSKESGRSKTWWAQAEAVGALALFAARKGRNADRFESAMQNIWAFTDQFFIDKEYGGWISYVTPQGAPYGGKEKSHEWQGVYHEIRGLINAVNAAKGIDS